MEYFVQVQLQEINGVVAMDNKIKIGAAGILTMMVVIMGANLLNQENVYYCEDRELAMQCDSLGVYYQLDNGKCNFFSEELERMSYKTCKTGWIKYNNNEERIEEDLFICDKKQGLITECYGVNTNKTLYKINN